MLIFSWFPLLKLWWSFFDISFIAFETSFIFLDCFFFAFFLNVPLSYFSDFFALLFEWSPLSFVLSFHQPYALWIQTNHCTCFKLYLECIWFYFWYINVWFNMCLDARTSCTHSPQVHHWSSFTTYCWSFFHTFENPRFGSYQACFLVSSPPALKMSSLKPSITQVITFALDWFTTSYCPSQRQPTIGTFITSLDSKSISKNCIDAFYVTCLPSLRCKYVLKLNVKLIRWLNITQSYVIFKCMLSYFFSVYLLFYEK